MQSLDFQPKTQEAISDELYKTAAKHAERNEMLHLLDQNPELFPGQNLSERVITSDDILDPGAADATAIGIERRYASLSAAYTQEYDNNPTLRSAVNAALTGSHIIHGTDHGEVIDIIFDHLKFSNLVRSKHKERCEKMGIEHPEKTAPRVGIVISKMVDYLGIESGGIIIPVRDILPLGFDKVYLPIPSNSANKTRFEPTARKRYNASVIEEITGDLRPRPFTNRRPMLLGVALPGSVNKRAVHSGDMVVGQFNANITKYTQYGLMLLTAVRMGVDISQLFVDDELHSVHDIDSVNYVGERLAKGASNLYGIPHVYDLNGDTKVVDQ